MVDVFDVINEAEMYLYYKHYDKINIGFKTKELKTLIKVIAYDTYTGAFIDEVKIKKKELIENPEAIFKRFKKLKEKAIEELNEPA